MPGVRVPQLGIRHQRPHPRPLVLRTSRKSASRSGWTTTKPRPQRRLRLYQGQKAETVQIVLECSSGGFGNHHRKSADYSFNVNVGSCSLTTIKANPHPAIREDRREPGREGSTGGARNIRTRFDPAPARTPTKTRKKWKNLSNLAPVSPSSLLRRWASQFARF